MPRPKKCRRVCCMPQFREFVPVNRDTESHFVVLTVDEYETIRLIDKMGLSQEECGEYMKIARTTVQQIYTNARKKLAEVLVDGLPLKIEGGDYTLCDSKSAHDGCGLCKRRKHICPKLNNKGDL